MADDPIYFRFRRGEDGVYRSYVVRPAARQRDEADDQPAGGDHLARFTPAQRVRLLVLRSRVLEGRLGVGPLADDLGPLADDLGPPAPDPR